MSLIRCFSRILFISILFITAWICCDSSTEPESTAGDILGAVQNVANKQAIHPAYMFMQDSLVCTTTENGDFALSQLERGNYTLTCSALGFLDTTVNVNVPGGDPLSLLIFLTPDSQTGRVYAEFQEGVLFQNQLAQDSTLSQWNEQEMWQGVTGATLQSKTLRRDLPPRQVFLGDSLVALTDDFGQCWFELQRGTYPFTAACDGYADTTRVIRIIGNERTYAIFVLDPAVP